MSERFKRGFIIAAILAIAIVFIYEFRPGRMGQPQATGGTDCVIEVAGSCVERTDYNAAWRVLAWGLRLDDEAVERFQLRRHVVQGLIERELLRKEAERLGVEISDEDITRELRAGLVHISLPVYYEAQIDERGDQGLAQSLGLAQTKGRMRADYLYAGTARYVDAFVDPKKKAFDYKHYESWVRTNTGMTPQDFRDWQRRELVAARVRALVQSRVQVSEAEARQRFEREGERLVVDYAKLANPWYVTWVVDGGDAALAAWTEKHAAEVDQAWQAQKASFEGGCRVVRQFVVDYDRAADDADAKKKALEEEVGKLRERIAKAKDPAVEFVAVVRERSTDPDSAHRDGLLGCVPKGEDALATALFSLEKVGDMSQVVEAQQGLAILRLEAMVTDAAEIEREARGVLGRNLYLGAEAERLSNEGAKQILAAVQGGKTLADALEAHVASTLESVKARLERASNKDGEKKPEAPLGPKEIEQWLGRAREDGRRPSVQSSLPFAQGEPAFAGAPVSATEPLFRLEKPGAIADLPVKLIGDARRAGYALVQLKERQAIKAEEWEKRRPVELDLSRRRKQRDAVVAYVQRLRRANADKIKADASLTKSQKSDEDG